VEPTVSAAVELDPNIHKPTESGSGMTTERTPQQEFGAAFAAFQTDLPHVGKGLTATVPTKAGGKYTYDYADLTTITETVLPLLASQGLTWSAAPDVTDSGFVLRYRLAHAAGHSEGGCYPLPDPSRSTPQEVGSAITYARRYALCAITGLAPGGDDDDGQKASAARSTPRAAPKPTPAVEESDPLEKARADLKRVMEAQGIDWLTVTPLFAAKYGSGKVIGNADAPTLTEFVGALRTGELTPA
jgi:hypothetical protein